MIASPGSRELPALTRKAAHEAGTLGSGAGRVRDRRARQAAREEKSHVTRALSPRNLGTHSCNLALEAAADARQALIVNQKAGRDHWR
jgi:2,3-bisphosphoglycerate-independent phosphoglycerate mutase